MPELPEVETVRLGLKPHIVSQVIDKIVIRQNQLRWPVTRNIRKILSNQKVISLSRRGKYLILSLERGHCLIHLGMSGRLHITQKENVAKKHDHVDIILKNGSILRYHDPRRFGAILYTQDDPLQHKLIKHLGPEPLSKAFNQSYLKKALQNKAIGIKKAIMDHKLVVGVGNIYASEALFRSQIHPERTANSLSDTDIKKLLRAIKLTLKKAIKAGGTTLKDFTNSEGKPGYFQQQLLVYGRKDLPCFTCDTKVLSKVIGGRNSFYCPSCQS